MVSAVQDWPVAGTTVGSREECLAVRGAVSHEPCAVAVDVTARQV